MFVAKEIFFVKGVGVHRAKLTSFEWALRDAGIASYNLVRVSSIFPPYCKIISASKGIEKLHHGSVVFAVIAESSTDEPNRLIVSSIGCAIPKDRSKFGYLSEHHVYGQTEKEAGDFAEDLAAEMLATTLGIEFDPDKNYDERKGEWKLKDEIVTTRNITQSAIGSKQKIWTTTIAAAILVP
ncbi:MAG: arginine decarboxylase, pyruvoyl-dependent [Deltaproteobacteria bacterium]|nr:arginine decarboxylase, pyruvoyl-dependent [Deltaproteobacteria bacterium]